MVRILASLLGTYDELIVGTLSYRVMFTCRDHITIMVDLRPQQASSSQCNRINQMIWQEFEDYRIIRGKKSCNKLRKLNSFGG